MKYISRVSIADLPIALLNLPQLLDATCNSEILRSNIAISKLIVKAIFIYSKFSDGPTPIAWSDSGFQVLKWTNSILSTLFSDKLQSIDHEGLTHPEVAMMTEFGYSQSKLTSVAIESLISQISKKFDTIESKFQQLKSLDSHTNHFESAKTNNELRAYTQLQIRSDTPKIFSSFIYIKTMTNLSRKLALFIESGNPCEVLVRQLSSSTIRQYLSNHSSKNLDWKSDLWNISFSSSSSSSSSSSPQIDKSANLGTLSDFCHCGLSIHFVSKLFQSINGTDQISIDNVPIDRNQKPADQSKVFVKFRDLPISATSSLLFRCPQALNLELSNIVSKMLTNQTASIMEVWKWCQAVVAASALYPSVWAHIAHTFQKLILQTHHPLIVQLYSSICDQMKHFIVDKTGLKKPGLEWTHLWLHAVQPLVDILSTSPSSPMKYLVLLNTIERIIKESNHKKEDELTMDIDTISSASKSHHSEQNIRKMIWFAILGHRNWIEVGYRTLLQIMDCGQPVQKCRKFAQPIIAFLSYYVSPYSPESQSTLFLEATEKVVSHTGADSDASKWREMLTDLESVPFIHPLLLHIPAHHGNSNLLVFLVKSILESPQKYSLTVFDVMMCLDTFLEMASMNRVPQNAIASTLIQIFAVVHLIPSISNQVHQRMISMMTKFCPAAISTFANPVQPSFPK